MTRTINATLQTGLETNEGRFIAKLELSRSTTDETISVVKGFEIDEGHLTAWVSIPEENRPTTVNVNTDNDTVFRISRGLNIGGTDYYFASSWYVVQEVIEDDYTITYRGHLFVDGYYEGSGDIAVNSFLSSYLSNTYPSGLGYSNTITYPTDDPWWKTIQFMADNLTFRTNNLQQLNTTLQQKYIARLIDLGDNELYPVDNGSFNEYEPIDPVVTPLTPVVKFNLITGGVIRKYFVWTDEDGTANSQGDGNDPQHNLGYIESTVTPHSLGDYSIGKVTAILSPPDLRLTGKDYVEIASPGGNRTWNDWYFIKETYSPGSRFPWSQTLESIKLLADTEGGPMPPALRPVVQHAQLDTSNFTGKLSVSENNIQAALDTLDKSADILGAFLAQTVVPASTTYYGTLFKPLADGTTHNFTIPVSGTISEMTLRIASAQPATGSLVVTLVINNVDTALAFVVPAGGGAAAYSNTTTTVEVTAGQIMRWKFVNNATSGSGQLSTIAMKLT